MIKFLTFAGVLIQFMEQEQVTGVIPARYDSTRFPGKPLALIKGKPMIRWVYEGVRTAFDHLVVATDDMRIAECVESFGGEWVMTRNDHRTGTERCLEAVEILIRTKGIRPDLVVNIQGDEPLMGKQEIRELIRCFNRPGTQIATLVTPFIQEEDPSDPNLVKVVLDKHNLALYFSRYPVPYMRNQTDRSTGHYLKHIGIYGYRTNIIREICNLPSSPLENAESLEQLRWLENGYRIRAAVTDYKGAGVDIPSDIGRIEKML